MRPLALLTGLGLLSGLASASPATPPDDISTKQKDSGVKEDAAWRHVFSRQETADADLNLPDERLEREIDSTRRRVRPPPDHGPKNRRAWSSGYDVDTDFYTVAPPNTGVTRKYNLVITERDNWVGGDGLVKQKAMLINGRFPGPSLEANWGDWMEVRVTNRLRTNGTGLHWHGVRFHNNNVNDGTNAITECPIAPGTSKTYRFRVEQYGTSWYHAHFQSQYANGVLGTLVFHGPASADYDEDLGAFPISDWYRTSADILFDQMISGWVDPNEEGSQPGDNPDSDTVLFNGKAKPDGGDRGEYQRVRIRRGNKYRLRLINTSVDNSFAVSIAGHNMTVIQTDFVPVTPYTTGQVFMSIGQRYDVLIDANQPVDNYWLNVTYSDLFVCGESKSKFPAAIIQYDGASPRGLPTAPGASYPDHLCGENIAFSPVVKNTVPVDAFLATANNTMNVNFTYTEANRIYWSINNHPLNVSWDTPTLQYLSQGVTDFPQRFNAYFEPDSNKWSFWIVQNFGPMSHPMHLHGHDVYILGHSPPDANPLENQPVPFDPVRDTPLLKFDNPTRRDVFHLPSNGWAVIAFVTDNPGAWLFHCHIAWHAGQGLSVQVVERWRDIDRKKVADEMEPVCARWRRFYENSPHKQIDSGV